MKSHLFVCACGSLQHQLVVQSDPDDDLPRTVYVSVHLAPLPLRDRLRVAWAYLRGRRSRYGAFEELVLDPETATDLADTLYDAIHDDAPDLFFGPNDVH